MPLPTPVCTECIVPPQSLSLAFPGGATLSFSLPSLSVPTTSELARQFFGNVNAALGPLMPIFATLDCLKAIVDCVSALPDVITKLDVQPLLECAPNLLEAVSKVVSMFPPLSLPSMVRDILTAMITFLQGLESDLDGAARQLQRIAQASTAAAIPGNGALLPIVSCAQAFYGQVMSHISGGAEPLNRLIGTLNMFLAMIPGVQPLPCLGSLDGAPEVILDALEAFISVLTIARNLLPGGLKLNPYTLQGEGC